MNDIKNLIDLHLQLDGIINFFWQAFVTVNTAIVGWLLAKNTKHSLKVRIIECLAYTMFASFIFIALSAKSTFFEAINCDLLRLAQTTGNFIQDSTLKKYILSSDRSTWDELWKWVFLSSATVINVFIYFDLFSRGSKSSGKVTGK